GSPAPCGPAPGRAPPPSSPASQATAARAARQAAAASRSALREFSIGRPPCLPPREGAVGRRDAGADGNTLSSWRAVREPSDVLTDGRAFTLRRPVWVVKEESDVLTDWPGMAGRRGRSPTAPWARAGSVRSWTRAGRHLDRGRAGDPGSTISR